VNGGVTCADSWGGSLITEDVPPAAPLGLTQRDDRFHPQRPAVPEVALANGHVAIPTAGSASGRGRHAAPPTPSEGHAKRFSIFSVIGGFVFVVGLALQAFLTERLKVPPLGSYLAQAVVSVEASFLLNRWLTWRDRDTPFWHAFFRFNIQKTVTIALNLGLYAGLLKIGFNYLVANVVLTIVFTVVNYAAGDKLVFSPRKARTEELAAAEPRTLPMPAIQLHGPPVSVVIPCRNNDGTIGDTIESLLDQDYPSLKEIILVGGPDDSTWDGLAGLDDPRLKLIERAAPPGVRDANFKRDIGIKMTRTDLVILVDSDIVLPRDWMSSAVTALQESGVSCVTGGMKSIHDSFWGRYTDNTVIGAKTPRIEASYVVTRENFGARGRKPPITANALFTRELYDRCAIDATWSHGSLEDYEWFWRVCKAGHSVLVSRDLFGWHYHRRGMHALLKEYRRSARGCAYFIKAHLDCPFARRRLRQAILIPLAAAVGTAGIAAAVTYGASTSVAALVLGCMGLLSAQQILRLRRLEAVAYPAVGLTLGLVYTARLVGTLLTAPKVKTIAGPVTETLPVPASRTTRDVLRPTLVRTSRTELAADQRSRRRRPRYVLLGICGLQAALSLSLVWSNSAFGDEAEYLWIGHLVWGHWLRGTQLPLVAAHLSGSALVYPPLGALADSLGGLAGARILSLVFMLFSTLLLYGVAARLIGRRGALFAAGLWAMTEPVIRLAFATYDSMSVALTALAAWLIVQAGFRRHRGEFVVAAALTLALANATAFSGVVADPLVIAFAFFAWRRVMKTSQAASATAWLAGSFCLFLCAVLTVTHSWSATTSIYARSSPDHQPLLHVLYNVWQYSGFVIVAALIGLLTARQAEHRQAGLLIILGLASFLVPAGQLAEQTGWSLDKHLAYGIWFAAIAGGYAASAVTAWQPAGRKWAAAGCCVAALTYLAVSGWESAWNVYHSWPNARSFVSAFAPVAATTQGILDVPGQEHVAEYYLPEGGAWQRWDTVRLSLAPPSSRTNWPAYYDDQLAHGDYGAIALFYTSSSDAAERLLEANLQSGVPLAAFTSPQQLSGLFPGEPGISDLTAALENDPAYRLVAVGSYNTETLAGNGQNGLYAIWRKV
jgi:putative flippase GtrA/glycosyltransferase involved in cell wall biosynthesis